MDALQYTAGYAVWSLKKKVEKSAHSLSKRLNYDMKEAGGKIHTLCAMCIHFISLCYGNHDINASKVILVSKGKYVR